MQHSLRTTLVECSNKLSTYLVVLYDKWKTCKNIKTFFTLIQLWHTICTYILYFIQIYHNVTIWIYILFCYLYELLVTMWWIFITITNHVCFIQDGYSSASTVHSTYFSIDNFDEVTGWWYVHDGLFSVADWNTGWVLHFTRYLSNQGFQGSIDGVFLIVCNRMSAGASTVVHL